MSSYKFKKNKIDNKCRNIFSEKKINPESGQAVLIAVILSLAVSMLILFGLSLPITDQIKNEKDYVLSKQAFLNSLTLNEEVLYRLNTKKPLPSSIGLSILNYSSVATTTNLNSSTIQVVSTGVNNFFERKTQALVSSNKSILFNYGVWISNGGIKMENSSEINGDVFSLGPIVTADTSTVSGTISNSLNSINLPISDDNINNWRNQASAGVVIVGGLNLSGASKSTTTTGALKIVGDLVVKNNCVFTLTGPLYVTGNLILDNSSRLQLNSSYGSTSETVVVDGYMDIKNSVYLGGSGIAGSNIIMATQNTGGCTDAVCTNPAIRIENTDAAAAVLVAPHGAIYLKGSGSTKGIFANYLYMSNSSSITYDSSLIDINFNSSTSTSWDFSSLKEI